MRTEKTTNISENLKIIYQNLKLICYYKKEEWLGNMIITITWAIALFFDFLWYPPTKINSETVRIFILVIEKVEPTVVSEIPDKVIAEILITLLLHLVQYCILRRSIELFATQMGVPNPNVVWDQEFGGREE